MSRAASRRRFRHVFMQNRIQPRLEVRARREPIGEPQRLDEGVLHQVLGVGRVPGQPQRGRKQRLQKLQGPAATVSRSSRWRRTLRPRNMAHSHNPRRGRCYSRLSRRSDRSARQCPRPEDTVRVDVERTTDDSRRDARKQRSFPDTPHRYVLCSCAPDALIASVKASAVRSRLLPYFTFPTRLTFEETS